MATLNGIPVNFGFTGTNGITVTNLSANLLLQDADESRAADLETVRDGIGDEVLHGWYNQHDEATLTAVITAASIAASITATTTVLKTPGTFITITECLSMPDLVSSVWEVQQGAKVSGSNTTAKRVTLPIKRYTKITAAAT